MLPCHLLEDDSNNFVGQESKRKTSEEDWERYNRS